MKLNWEKYKIAEKTTTEILKDIKYKKEVRRQIILLLHQKLPSLRFSEDGTSSVGVNRLLEVAVLPLEDNEI